MSIDFKNCSEEEMWKFVASELSRNDIDAILVGGAVVSIYTEGAYKSGDLDFVLNELTRKKLDKTLDGIGFLKDGRFYKHPECQHLFLEFASFPASIGNDHNIKADHVKHKGEILKIFSPTDCVRDRLASYAFFQARECFDQAVMVAKKHEINISKVKKWCNEEKIENVFDEFLVAISE